MDKAERINLTTGVGVMTPDGVGIIKTIENLEHCELRYGVKHEVYPKNKPEMYHDDILYYWIRDLSWPVKEESDDADTIWEELTGRAI